MNQARNKRWMSLWRHFFEREKTVDELTASMIEWQEKWRWNFIKLNPPACYHVLDWGAEYEFFKDPSKEPKMIHPAITDAQDVEKIQPIDVTRGNLGNQLQVIRNLRKHFGPDLPIFETVFSPPEIAHRLMNGREALKGLRRDAPKAFEDLLNRITSVFREFCAQCLAAGASGIFYATKWAGSEQIGWDDYARSIRPLDLAILHDIRKNKGMILLHVCGGNTYLDRMLDYPADIVNYDFFAPAVPPAEELLKSAGGAHIMGGIDPDRLISDVSSVIADCARYTSYQRWYAGPSCVVSPATPDRAIEELKERLWPVL